MIALQDASGNTVTTANASVTLSITPGTGTTDAVLSGDISINAVNGVATFSGLSIDKIGSGYTLTAISSGLTDATNDSFDIVEITSKLNISGYITSVTVGVAKSFTVIAQDGLGNTVTNGAFCQ